MVDSQREALRYVLFLQESYRGKLLSHSATFAIPPQLRQGLKNKLHDTLPEIGKLLNQYLGLVAHPVDVVASVCLPGTSLALAEQVDKKRVVGHYVAGDPATITMDIVPGCPLKRLLAVLAHEMCHHLNACLGIHAPPGLNEERMTDYAAVVVGLGDMILPGYRPVEYTMGSVKLGYVPHERLIFAGEICQELQRPACPLSQHIKAGKLVKTAIHKMVALPQGREVLVLGIKKGGHKFVALDLADHREAVFSTAAVCPAQA